NRSTEDAVSIALHTALTHLQLPNTYVRMLICGLQFSLQHSDPGQAGTEAPQPGTALIAVPLVVRIGDNTSSTLVLSTGTPQGCVLSPALFTLFTSDCSAIHSTNTIVKLLTNFYRATIESILCLSAAVWYGSCTAQDQKDLAQGGENSTGDCGKSSSRPDLDSMYAGWWIQKKARHIADQPYPPGKWTVCTTASIWKT
ncbi:hypothetical protein L3Q82_019915, partial [Scortum barcoo]